MPRKRKLKPPPIEAFELNGVEVELRDETCWWVGSGQASALEHYLSIKKPIYAHINEILFEDAATNKLRVTGIQEVREIFETPTKFAKQCAMWGVFGSEGKDDTNARKRWYPVLRSEILSMLELYESKILGTFATQKIQETSVSVNASQEHAGGVICRKITNLFR